MNKRETCILLLAVLCLAWCPIAWAEVTTNNVIDEQGNYIVVNLATEFDELTPISSTDLINGFGVNDNESCEDGSCTVGLPINQGINESAIAPYALGWIDPYNGPQLSPPALPGVGSWLMADDDCRALNYVLPSDGFYFPPLAGNGSMSDLVDGVAGNFLKTVLRDYGRASLVVRYGFEAPTDIGRIRVYAGNLHEGTNNGRDGRSFQYYDVYARQGDCAGGTCPAGPLMNDGFDEFFLVAQGVASGTPGVTSNNTGSNPTPWEGTLTDVINFNADVLVEDCTDLRIVLYCVSNADGFFVDPYQAYTHEPAPGDVCSNGFPAEEGWDADGYRKAFQAPIIKEIDVFGPIDTPWGDIDYDGDLDLDDFARFQYCFGGDVTSDGCYRYDYNEDDIIDLDDFFLMEPNITGPQ